MASLIWVIIFSLPSFWGLLLPPSEGSPASLAFHREPGQESCGTSSASPAAPVLVGGGFLLAHSSWSPENPSSLAVPTVPFW